MTWITIEIYTNILKEETCIWTFVYLFQRMQSQIRKYCYSSSLRQCSSKLIIVEKFINVWYEIKTIKRAFFVR